MVDECLADVWKPKTQRPWKHRSWVSARLWHNQLFLFITPIYPHLERRPSPLLISYILKSHMFLATSLQLNHSLISYIQTLKIWNPIYIKTFYNSNIRITHWHLVNVCIGDTPTFQRNQTCLPNVCNMPFKQSRPGVLTINVTSNGFGQHIIHSQWLQSLIVIRHAHTYVRKNFTPVECAFCVGNCHNRRNAPFIPSFIIQYYLE